MGCITKHPTPNINMKTLIFVLVQLAVAFCHPGQQRAKDAVAEERFLPWLPGEKLYKNDCDGSSANAIAEERFLPWLPGKKLDKNDFDGSSADAVAEDRFYSFDPCSYMSC